MKFIWPWMLLFLFLVPLLAWLYFRLQARRRKLARAFSGLGLGSKALPRPGLHRHLPPVLFMAALIVLITALARPQTVVSLPRVEGTVILAFDISGSMAADDMKPTRIEAAKAAAREFIKRQPSSVRIGVTAFSDNGFSVQAPTNDRGAILAVIDHMLPQHGTSLGQGILASLKTIAANESSDPLTYSNLTPAPTLSPTPVPPGTHTSAAIVLLSDGDNNEPPDPLTIAQTAANLGVRIYTIGLGDPAGTILHVNGFTVRTRLDEATLKQIAEKTGGEYYNASSAEDLTRVYDNLKPKLTIKATNTEVTALFSGASILILLAGGVLSLLWFNRLL